MNKWYSAFLVSAVVYITSGLAMVLSVLLTPYKSFSITVCFGLGMTLGCVMLFISMIKSENYGTENNKAQN